MSLSTKGTLLALVATLAFGQQGGPAERRPPAPVIRLRIFPDQMIPSELRLPPGEYYIRIDNYATTGVIPIQIDNTKDNRPAQRLFTENMKALQARWNKTLTLEKGEYLIDAVRHPNWRVWLLVDPAYPLPAVR